MSAEKVRPGLLVRWISILTSPPLKISPFLLVDLLIKDGALFRAERGPQTPVKHRIDRTVIAMLADQFIRRHRHVGERGMQARNALVASGRPGSPPVRS